MKKAFVMMAPMAPAAVEFHIHQVVPAFQISMARKHRRKNRILSVLSANTSSGIQAINIKPVKGDVGHEQTNNNPDIMLKVIGWYFFNYEICKRQDREF